MERKNAMHVELPERVDFISIDTSWTRLDKIVPNALRNLKEGGQIIALVKPHYEAEPKMIRKGKLPDEAIPEVLNIVKERLKGINVEVISETESPILGGKKKNKEYLFHLKKSI
jgi:23S rRNA (cytidine1920-2'-O)/16S rRNA (cytidine1409-2'-O)-methyltransferase